MKIIASLVGVLVLFPQWASADPLQDFMKQQSTAMRADIGKTFWISKPFDKGLELCPSAMGRFKECRHISNVSLTVKSVVPSSLGSSAYGVELEDGRKGFILGLFRERLLSPNLTPGEKDKISRCERDGPAIGATAMDVRNCWGPPRSVNTTSTAAGKTEQFVFPQQGYVYLTDGIVTAVQTTR